MFKAAAQKPLESPAFKRRHLALSVRVLLILSTTPFCCGVFLTEKCLRIPFSPQNCINFLSVYSVPLSDLKYLIFLPVWFSTSTFQILNLAKTSDLCFNKYTQTFLEKSSTNVTKYLEPPMEGSFVGPQTSEWT